MRARAPASSANLGPGFDALAVALQLYVEVSVEEADELSVHASGEGAGLPADATHLAARVAAGVVGHDRVAIEVHSEIPVGRGLGSSAALAVAAAAAAGSDDPFIPAAAADGHPENAAASTVGGLVAATTVDGAGLAHRLPLDPELRFVVVVPERELPTARAREVLPAVVSREDAAFNLGRMGLLIAGLGDHRLLVAAATEDRIHQPARTALFPEAPAILADLLEAGALASCWSGAGSSLLAICTDAFAGAVEAVGRALLEDHRLGGTVMRLEADLAGVTLLSSPAS
ncbi:MAG: homoserine kinase [Acidimicrobiales bacterium]